MVSYKDLIAAIRQGKTPRQIIEELGLNPTKARRLLDSKALREYLQIEEEIAALIAAHKTAGSVHIPAQKLLDLVDSDSPETARKVCLALLSEGLRASQPPEGESGPVTPGSALKQLTASPPEGLVQPVRERPDENDNQGDVSTGPS